MNKKIFIIALSCCMFICNVIVNTASATKLAKFHDMLHNNKYMMIYTEQYLINDEITRKGEVTTWVRDGESEYFSTRRDWGKDAFYHDGVLCVDGEYYQVEGEQKIGKEIKYRTHNYKSGIEKYPSDLGKAKMKHKQSLVSQLLQFVYGDNDMTKWRYVGEGTLTDGMTYEDYASYYDMMGIQQDAGTVIRCIFSGDELKQIISKNVMPSLQGGGADMTNIVEFEKFTDVIDTDCFQLPVTQKVYDSGIKDYYIAEE